MHIIHPTAIVDHDAELGEGTCVGPYSIIESGVTVGAHCHIGPHVHILGNTIIGDSNRFHSGCVIGDDPQDFKFRGEKTRLRIGNGNIFREHVTIHRSNSLAEDTVIGSENAFMACSHIGHNSQVGNKNVFVNGCLIAGHVQIGDHNIFSGNTMVHQFVRVGSYAMMQGGSAISKDLPPYCMATRQNHVCGLNSVGIRRHGFSATDRSELKELYRYLFIAPEPWQEKLPRAYHRFKSPAAIHMLEFISSSSRGVCSHGRE
ncbi:MAG: acyl-ACP--UDP-N-acetylglucosamine O-acyltransferase [Verrucomicrobia bacterium]|nr:acyl-ACP--UDP-N-acetylglucosamine O-acyltransferase [Verrucomicrobiota bacterium]